MIPTLSNHRKDRAHPKQASHHKDRLTLTLNLILTLNLTLTLTPTLNLVLILTLTLTLILNLAHLTITLSDDEDDERPSRWQRGALSKALSASAFRDIQIRMDNKMNEHNGK